MKSPDETKKGLNDPIPVHFHIGDPEPRLTPLTLRDLEVLHTNALALIQQLEVDKQQLEGMLTHMNQLRDAAAGRALNMEERVHQLEAERDAAVRDCGCFPCQTCEERENGDLCPMCEIQGGYRKFHQWRGVQKEE